MNLPPLINRKLREQYGFDEQVYTGAALDSTVRIRMESTGIYDETAYWEHLTQDGEEFRAFAECLLVPESWFFRDRSPFEYLVRWVRERVQRVSPEVKPLQILSVPCALGQEPYSIVISLLEAGLQAGSFKVWAGDVSETFLQRARHAVYGPIHFRGGSAAGYEAYFEGTGENHLRVIDLVRQSVEFRRINLLDRSTLVGLPVFDAVFCRNVLIYFSTEARQSLVGTLHQLLADDGLLCIGHADSIPLLQSTFSAIGPPGAFCYTPRQNPAVREPIFATGGKPKAVTPALSDSKRPPRKPAARVAADSPAAELAAGGIDWIRRLADGGHLAQAEAGCREHLAKNGAVAEAYCLLGQILSARGRGGEAERSFRRAAYLQPDNAEAIFQLALLAEQRGDTARAQLLRTQAKKLAAT